MISTAILTRKRAMLTHAISTRTSGITRWWTTANQRLPSRRPHRRIPLPSMPTRIMRLATCSTHLFIPLTCCLLETGGRLTWAHCGLWAARTLVHFSLSHQTGLSPLIKTSTHQTGRSPLIKMFSYQTVRSPLIKMLSHQTVLSPLIKMFSYQAGRSPLNKMLSHQTVRSALIKMFSYQAGRSPLINASSHQKASSKFDGLLWHFFHAWHCLHYLIYYQIPCIARTPDLLVFCTRT